MTWRLIGWLGFVGLFIVLSYASRAVGAEPEEDVVYTYDFFANGLLTLVITGVAVLLVTLGAPRRELLAVRRPRSWRAALLIGVAVVVTVYVVAGLTAALGGDAGDEQGLTPEDWNASRVAPFVASLVAVAVFAPVGEELLYRGLGFSLLQRYGRPVAIVTVGLLFGLAHGLVVALPILATFGIGLAYVRSRSESVLPCIVIHGAFNATALVGSVLA